MKRANQKKFLEFFRLFGRSESRGLKPSKNKRGLSPVITTVLLIAIAMFLAMVILLWAINWYQEAIKKDGRPIRQVCDEVIFTASYVDAAGPNDEIWVNNLKDVSVYAFNIQVKGNGEETVTENKRVGPVGAETDLTKGGSGMFNVPDVAGGSTITIVPVLTGDQGEKEVKYACDDCIKCKVEIER